MNHEKHHMDEREVAEHLREVTAGRPASSGLRRRTLEIGWIHFGGPREMRRSAVGGAA